MSTYSHCHSYELLDFMSLKVQLSESSLLFTFICDPLQFICYMFRVRAETFLDGFKVKQLFFFSHGVVCFSSYVCIHRKDKF